MSEWIMSAEDIDDITGGRFTVGQKLVRCKDCRWWCTDCMPEEFGWCDATVNRSTAEDWFCADGERKE